MIRKFTALGAIVLALTLTACDTNGTDCGGNPSPDGNKVACEK